MRRAIEFFAGIGLVRLGLERSGWQVVFANDIDEKKATLYRANFGDEHFHLGDIFGLSPRDLPEVDLATASFPCIDLSLAGNMKGLEGKHSSAYWGFHRLIDGMGRRRPKSLLLENVVGLLHSHRGRDLRDIITSLNDLGYVCEILQVDAAEFVPQSRPRLFIVGHRDLTDEAPHFSAAHPARSSAILDFKAGNGDLRWFNAWLPEFPRRTLHLLDVLETIPIHSPLWWDLSRQKHLESQMSSRHRLLLKRAVRADHVTPITVYKRVRPDGCMAELRNDGKAGCLRTPRGGSSKQFVIFAGRGEWRVRNMTAREYGRLQGTDETYRTPVPENVALFGFGDAVCVPVIDWVVRSAINPFHEAPASSPPQGAYAETVAL